jgi:NADH dehydrogenase
VSSRAGVGAPPRVVIIGGGFGGLTAARSLKRAPVQVTLIDKQNHHTFQPLLYQVATAALESTDVAFPLRSLLRRHENTEVLMAEVESVDAAAHEVHLAGGHRVPFDYLIYAAGAQSFYFGHPEFRADAPGLKTVADALEMRYRVLMAFERAEQSTDPEEQRQLLTFIIVGGGPTGVELAGAVAELAGHALDRDFRNIDPTKAKVILVEGGPAVLPTYPPSLQAKAKRSLEKLGVEVRTGARVRAVDEHCALIDDESIMARTILWGAGVIGTPLARSLGVPLDRKGRIEVNEALNPPGMPHVFVIGDSAVFLQDGHPIPGVAPAAMQGARYAARAIRKLCAGEPIPKPFHYRFKGELATIGRSRAVAKLPGNIKLSGFFAWLMYLNVHLMYLGGLATRVRVFLSWVWSYFTWARGARLIPSETMAKHEHELIERYEVPHPPPDEQPPAPH